LTPDSRVERRRVRLFFAGLLVVSAILDVVGALLIQHQTRNQVLDSLLPTSVTLGGRTGAVLSGLALLLLAGGIARGKRVALRLTLVVLAANIVFDLVKDLDFEFASLLAWILFGLWWFRSHFQADSDPASVRWGVAALASGVALAIVYAVFGALVLESQLTPETGPAQAIREIHRLVVGVVLPLPGQPQLGERLDMLGDRRVRGPLVQVGADHPGPVVLDQHFPAGPADLSVELPQHKVSVHRRSMPPWPTC